MTPKVSCVVVAKKGHIWHEAGLAGGREYVVIVRPDGKTRLWKPWRRAGSTVLSSPGTA
jgi:hypothetical protein